MNVIDAVATTTNVADVVHKFATFPWTKKTLIQLGIVVAVVSTASAVLYVINNAENKPSGGEEDENKTE